LKPWDERRDAAQHARSLVNQLNNRLITQIPDAFAFAFMPPAIPGLGSSGGFSFWLQDRGGRSVEFLDKNVRTFIEAARKRPELSGVATLFSASDPQVYAKRRSRQVPEAKRGGRGCLPDDAGISRRVIREPVQPVWAAVAGVHAGRQRRADGFGRYRPLLRAERRPGDGAAVGAGDAEQGVRSAYTTRFNLYRAVQLLGDAAPGYSSGQALDALEEVAKATLPPDMGYEFADLSYQERKASGTIAGTFALSLGFVFLILAGLYESWFLPLSVLLSVPISIFGAFLGLYLRSFDLDVFAQIGLVMLIGLAAKNAILIVEFSKDRLEAGSSLVDAALEGARVRLRPILMTSFAFILGTVPLWVATGSGGASRGC
jgi:Cation/multidrug efflux pump